LSNEFCILSNVINFKYFSISFYCFAINCLQFTTLIISEEEEEEEELRNFLIKVVSFLYYLLGGDVIYLGNTS